MVYTEDGVVHHKLFEYRGEFQRLLFRSFWREYSKGVMDLLYPDAPDDKSAYLKQLLIHFLPKRLRELIRSPSVAGLLQLIRIFVFIGAVGIGYLSTILTPNVVERANS